jgi:hypothetical protein
LNGDVNVSSTTIHYPTAGTYSYYVAVSGESLCEGEASAIGRKEVKVTVNKYATALDLNINGETTICYEETATLTVTSVATPSIENPVYRWYASSTSTTPFFIGNVYTTTALLLDSTFYISVLGDNYCENEVNDRASVTITVTKKSTASNLSISGKTTVCIGENTTLTASVTAIPAIENPVYRWYASPANETPFYIGNIYTTTALTSDTTFYISVSGDNHCENDANIAGRKMVTISVLPYSTLSMLTFTGDSICSGKPAMLTASAPSVENPVFRWYASASGDDLVFTGTPFITPELSKDTTYYLTVLGDNYCETIERAAVNVSVVCFTLKGTLFPFVYTGDEEFDTLFVLNAELFSVPPANSPDPIDEILESLPLHTVRAKHYDGSEHVHGTPKYPGYISSTDNPGEPISWHYIGKEKGEVDNTLLEEEDTPDQPVGLYRFDSIRRGDYILVLSRYGFISKFIKITVNDNMILGHRELIPGDVNGDLEVNAHDISFLISKYSSFGSTKYNAKYDLNGDGNIDGVDVSIIRFVINAHMGMYYDTEQWLLEY